MLLRATPILAAFALALCALSPGLAAAQDEDARHHFRLGEAHYESGHFVEAAHEFERSYELSRRPELLHNIYVSYRDASDLPHAADALRRYLAAMPDISNRTLLERRLAAMEASIADQGSSPAPAEPEASPPTPTPAAAASSPPARSSSGGDEGALSPVGFIVGGLGAAMMITGAITGGVAMGSSDELASMCPNMVCPPGYDYESTASTGSALALTTDIMLGVGGAALIAGVILILVLRDAPAESVARSCGPAGCSVGVRF